MGLFVIDSFIVKSEKQNEFMLYLKKVDELRKNRPDLFKEINSFRIFNQIFGEQVGNHYIMMLEVDNMEDLAKGITSYFTDPEMIKNEQEFMLLIEPSSFARRVWTTIE